MDEDWLTDSFGIVEFSNILTTYERNGRLTPTQVREYIATAEHLFNSSIVPVTHETALEYAMRYKVTAYDARYLAIAEALGVLLVTEDARLRKAAPHLTQSLDDALMAAGGA